MNTASPVLSRQRRINSLDFLRGVASFAVCWYHLTWFHYPSPDGPFYQMVRATGKYGWLGVEVFFVISGFVIPYSLDRAGYKLKTYPTFILKRLVRLDPPYLACLALILALAYAHASYSGKIPEVEGASVGIARILLHLGYLNMFSGYSWLNPSFWTLAIEFQYYLMMGLAFPVINSRRRFVRVAALACFAMSGFVSGHWLVSSGGPSTSFIFYFAFLFVMGIVTFQRHAGLVGRKEYGLLLFVASVGAFATVGAHAALAGLFAVLVINFYNKKNPIAAFFGNISYSLYLLHWPLGHLTLSVVGAKFLGATSDLARMFMLAVALGVCIGSAYLLYLLVEKPAQRWSAAIRYGRRPSESAAPEEVSGLAPAIGARLAWFSSRFAQRHSGT